MSEMFEGAICRCPAATARAHAAAMVNPISIEAFELPDNLLVVCQSSPRRSSAFADDMDCFTCEISKSITKALLIRYDSRVGHRSSRLYVEGHLKREFGQNDELFVPLDEKGEPITTGPHIKFNEMVANEEYETIKNAIELGLSEFGSGSWTDLKQLIGRI